MIALDIITPLGEYLKEDVKSIGIRSVEGQMTILSNHLPIVAALVPCRLVLKQENDKSEEFALSGGFLQFADNKALILTDAIEGTREIDLERARAAYERARKRLEKKDTTTNMKRAELALQRALNRINVSGGAQ